MLPILQEYVLPGTQVMSDLWRSYGGIAALPEGYGHLTVNHSVNFVDPVSGEHTQNVENMWMRYKRKVKSSMGLNTPTSDRYNNYLQEFIWRQAFGEKSKVFLHLWSQISKIYLCQH